ncbi:hypothetical protein TNCV_3347891 [Trichonephila clavipes]|nr:hypothetical protein TNCV_3347891 [Trichonephila clavipes]
MSSKVHSQANRGRKFTAPKHIHLLSSPLGRRYASISVRIISGNIAGSHFLQLPVRPPATLLSPHLMTQNDVLGKFFSLLGTGESHTELSLVNRGIWKTEFWRGTLLSSGIDVLVRCNEEDTIRQSARTEAIYDEWISSNDVFEKFASSAICASV